MWIGRDGDLDGARTIAGTDAGGHAVTGLDAQREGGAEWRPALRHHRQIQALHLARRQRQADQAAAKLGHEVDGLRRGVFGGEDQIAFVLAILVIHEDDGLTGADLCDRALHARKQLAVLSFGIFSIEQADWGNVRHRIGPFGVEGRPLCRQRST